MYFGCIYHCAMWKMKKISGICSINLFLCGIWVFVRLRKRSPHALCPHSKKILIFSSSTISFFRFSFTLSSMRHKNNLTTFVKTATVYTHWLINSTAIIYKNAHACAQRHMYKIFMKHCLHCENGVKMG